MKSPVSAEPDAVCARYRQPLSMIAWEQQFRRLRPWLLGALAWTFLSLMVLLDHAGRGEPKHLALLWFVLSLLWWQFCFAGIFSALRHHQPRLLPGLLLVSLVPPALLHLLIRLLT